MDFVINKLQQQLMEENDLIALIQGDVKSLCEELINLQVFIREAIRIRSRSEILKHFVKKVSTEASIAEDIIDKFMIDAKLHQEKGMIRKFFDFYHFIRAKHCCEEIRSIEKKLKGIRRDGAYDLMSLRYEDPKNTSQELRRSPVTEEDEVVGFDEEAKSIIDRLIGGSDDLEVISIVGMPGLGKTTIARKIFKDYNVEYMFYTRIWVYVSQSYTQRDLFLNIINQFTRNTEQYQNVHEDVLAEELRKHFLERRYLLVLDDIWTMEAFDAMKVALPNNRNRSRVLLTTRNNMLALNNCPHHLKFLTEYECWELLQKKVFHKDKCPPDLEKLGMCIARKCVGLPLATLVIAGALNARGKTKSEWERVYQGVSEHIISNDLMAKKFVQMSYDSLPFNLKVCFLYCGVFPRGSDIPAWKIVRLWIAEGFIEDRVSPTPETLAEEYLNALVNKSLLLVTRRTSNGQIKTCQMHDILHEFCRLVASEENFFKEIKLGVERFFPRNQELATFRRLCIDSSVEKFISTKPYGDGIRSFLSFSSQRITVPPDELETIPKSFPLLRVVDIESISFPSFHKQFLQLYHLRYIALSCHPLRTLPKFMGDLRNLETLIILTQQDTLDIKADIFNMPRLRHLHTNASAKLCPSASVKTDNHGALQTLSAIEPESCKDHVFARCQNLKKLDIRGKITDLVGLSKLECLEKLKLMNDHLAGGKLHLPSENLFPMKLKQITLSGTRLDWNEMDKVLGHLEFLEVLKLKENAFEGDCWESKDYGFPCLKVLLIERLDLVSWKVSELQFPRLERLVLRSLHKLEEVPIQLANISSLQMIKLEKTARTTVESARKIESRSKHTGLKLYCN